MGQKLRAFAELVLASYQADALCIEGISERPKHTDLCLFLDLILILRLALSPHKAVSTAS